MAVVELKNLPRQIIHGIKGMIVETLLPLFLMGICFLMVMILLKIFA